MKTSIKILLVFVCLCIVAITTILIIVKVDIQHYWEKANKKSNIKLELNFNGISSVIASSKCNITITRDKKNEIFYSDFNGSVQSIAFVDTINKTLVINAKLINDTLSVPNIRIHMTYLKKISTINDARVEVKNFFPDTLQIEATDNSSVVSKCKPTCYMVTTHKNAFVNIENSKKAFLASNGNSTINISPISFGCTISGSLNDSSHCNMFTRGETTTNFKIAGKAYFNKN